MAIWKRPVSLELMSASRKDTLVDHLGIELIELGEDFLKGRMPVDRRTRQPYGILHGGASSVLGETLGSIAANYCVEHDHYCVGLEINTSHIKMIREGYVFGIAKPMHLGKSTQTWEIPIYDQAGDLISVNRLRTMVLKRKE